LRQYVQAAILALLFAWLAYTAYQTVHYIGAYYMPLPQGDYWRVPQHLKAYQTFQLDVFWKQHNEHRIIFPEIVFALDMLREHGRMVLPTVCSILCYLLTWGILCFVVISDREAPFFDRWSGVLVAGVISFYHGSAFSLAQPFLLEWPMMQFGVVLALFFLKKTADSSRLLYLVLTIAAAVVATYSSANALLLWPLLLAIGWLQRLSRRFMIVLAISSVAFVGLYFVNYQFLGNTNLLLLVQNPGFFIGFVAMYLCSPFSNLISPTFGITVGLLNLGMVVLAAVQARKLRLLGTTTAVVLFGFYAFTLLTALITAAGRMDLNDKTFLSPRAVRYITVPMLNWAAVVLLGYWISARAQWRILTARGMTLAYTLLLLIGMYKLRSWRETNEASFKDSQLAAMSIDVGLTDPELISRIFPSPAFLEIFMPAMKTQHLALFDKRHDEWLGTDMQTRFFKVLDAKMPGEISYVRPVEKGLEVVGWANSSDVRDPYPRILLANERGQVVGWGRRPGAGFPSDWLTLNTPEHESWVAYANLAIPSKTIGVYAVTRRGLMAIGSVQTVPPIQGAAKSEVGVAIKDVAWQMDKTWGLDGMPVATVWGWLPKTTPVYSSWQQRDENTGRLTAEAAMPANGCISMGVLHGPIADGLSAQFVDADTGAVLGDVPFRDHDYLWSLWKIKPGANVKRVKFVATDNGKGWGEWMAVSGPMECN